jgi:hypothetical protein
MATRFAGSDDLFRANGRAPWNAVNYLACHDGMTLRDLYSYSQTQNDQPFPNGPSPGGRSSDAEMCWDHGGDPVEQLQAVRTGLAILFLSVGTLTWSRYFRPVDMLVWGSRKNPDDEDQTTYDRGEDPHSARS